MPIYIYEKPNSIILNVDLYLIKYQLKTIKIRLNFTNNPNLQ